MSCIELSFLVELYLLVRKSSPYINRFIQPDNLTPGGPQGLNRYSYVNNGPINFNDPSGHMQEDFHSEKMGCKYRDGSQYFCDSEGKLMKRRTWKHPSTSPVNKNKPDKIGPYYGGYMGGASPADVYHWQDFSSGSSSEASSPLIESFADVSNIAAMNAPNGGATLQAFLTYDTSESGDVINIEITIVNEGESSATLEKIEMSETALPSMNSCAITTNCLFRPSSSVSIDPGELETITICQNCLANNSTIYNHPSYPNKNNYIEVFMVLSMPINTGSNGVERNNLPFIYTIPPR